MANSLDKLALKFSEEPTNEGVVFNDSLPFSGNGKVTQVSIMYNDAQDKVASYTSKLTGVALGTVVAYGVFNYFSKVEGYSDLESLAGSMFVGGTVGLMGVGFGLLISMPINGALYLASEVYLKYRKII